ncbi:MAG: porin [Rhodospirillales bacterium]|nr:porin [Rhodospirillales bacterium]
MQRGSCRFRSVLAGTAQAQGEVTVGGAVEVVGGTSDHADGQDGFDRGLFSRINVNYSNTLDNGLVISGNIAYLLNQRGANAQPTVATDDINEMMMDDGMMMGDMDIDVSKTQNRQNYAPDILAISVGGGFGTVTMGHHAMAACATLPRPIAFVPGGVNATWYTLFFGVGSNNVTHSEVNYCGTPTGISYSTPSMGGLSAMISYAPNMDADQTGSLSNASSDGEDYLNAAVTFGSDMGGMNINVGAAFQTAADDYVDSVTIAASAGMGGATVGFSWYDNGDNPDGTYRSGTTGWTVGAKYSLGAITPGITYSSLECDSCDDQNEETALVVGASYAVGGGLGVFVEYLGLERTQDGVSDDETLLMSGVTLGF